MLRRQRLLAGWRQAVDHVFQTIEPAMERQLYPADAPRRLVVQLYGTGIAIQAEKLWSRFRGTGVRLPLDLSNVRGADAFLRPLFAGAGRSGPGAALFTTARAAAGETPFDAWIVESHDVLHDCCEIGNRPAAPTTPSRA